MDPDEEPSVQVGQPTAGPTPPPGPDVGDAKTEDARDTGADGKIHAPDDDAEGKADGKTADGKPAEVKTGEGKNKEGNPDEAKPSDGKTGEGKPQGKPGEGKPGEDKPGEVRVDEPKAKDSKAKKKGSKKSKKKASKEDGDVSSGEEYTDNLMENYIGQVGALTALGVRAEDVLNMKTWMETLDVDERNSLLPHLPSAKPDEQNVDAVEFLSGKLHFFGDLREEAWKYIVAGMTHPRIRRWKQRLILLQRRRYVQEMKEYHDHFVRSILVRKRPRIGGVADLKTGTKVNNATRPIVAGGNDYMEGWDEARIKRVMDYRKQVSISHQRQQTSERIARKRPAASHHECDPANTIQESERYKVPEKAFVYHNEWGDSVVAPLKRGPALDGGRPREHPLLKNERPSHVTILCLVRDGASRLKNNEGTRQEICDLLVDSQYIREGATMVQLNQVVSGALDRLHYEDDACVRYDPETKHWCYLHNSRKVIDFKMPSWARGGKRSDSRKRKASTDGAQPGTAAQEADKGDAQNDQDAPATAESGERGQGTPVSKQRRLGEGSPRSEPKMDVERPGSVGVD